MSVCARMLVHVLVHMRRSTDGIQRMRVVGVCMAVCVYARARARAREQLPERLKASRDASYSYCIM